MPFMKWCYHNERKQQFLPTWSLLRIILVIVRGCADKSEIVGTCVLCFSLILILQWMTGLVSLTVVVGNGRSVVVVRVKMMIEFVLLLIVCVYMCQCVCVWVCGMHAHVHECISVCYIQECLLWMLYFWITVFSTVVGWSDLDREVVLVYCS